MNRSINSIDKYLNYEFRNIPIATSSENFYVNLSTTTITPSSPNPTVVSGEGYTCVSVPKNTTSWAATDDGEIVNSIVISFPQNDSYSSSYWGEIRAITIGETEDGSNPVFYYNLDGAIDAPIGTKIIFGAGSLKFSRNNEG